MSWSIRLAGPDDLPAIVDISNWAAAHTPANFAIEPESLAVWQASFEQTHELYPWFVALDEGGGERVAGFAKASPWKGRCAYAYSVEITVYVHPDKHRQGIGRALYGRLLPTLAAQGYQTALGGITLPNPASVRLHESFGMKRTAIFHQIGWKFGTWHDVGYWEKRLRAADEPPPARIVPVRAAHNSLA